MFVWMFVVLKIPIVAALLLIWYAIQEPEPLVDDDDGGSRLPLEPGPRPPRPRRGPHDARPAPAPDRVRLSGRRRGRRPAGR